MPDPRRRSRRERSSRPYAPWWRSGGDSSFNDRAALIAFAAFWLVLAVVGGASRADTLGQLPSRLIALAALATWALTVPAASLRPYRAPALILAGAVAIAAMQLIPLPPDIWTALPGRGSYAPLAGLAGFDQPARPLALVPDAALNALFALTVPSAALVGMMVLGRERGRWMLPLILAVACWSASLALLQVSAGGFDNPFVNSTPGDASGIFANHNHQALLMSIGLLLAPSWGFGGEQRRWRVWSSLGLIVLFTLMIVASGSRAGLFLGGASLLMGGLVAREPIRRAAAGAPRFAVPVAAGAMAILLAGLVFLGFNADRAASLDRLLALETGADMRVRAFPTVWSMTAEFFPAGSGLGSFDAVFRGREPLALLKPTYFNHAHNDWIELVLETGAIGLLLLGAGVAWWASASWRAWRDRAPLARLGSAIVALTMAASIVDYPARTPMIMAVLVVAACWLAAPSATRAGSANGHL